MNHQGPFTIMILEDNGLDVILLKQALRKAAVDFTSLLFEDGESAFMYIDVEVASKAKPRLDAAILDLNVPKRDGAEVLAQIRHSAELKNIAVIVLSSLPRQVMMTRASHADRYIRKPNDLSEYLLIGEDIRTCIETVLAGS